MYYNYDNAYNVWKDKILNHRSRVNMTSINYRSRVKTYDL
jgi:hypothetical protein